MKNIYTYLEEMDFENLCKEKTKNILLYNKSKMSEESFDNLCQNVFFSVIQEFYGKILEDEQK